LRRGHPGCRCNARSRTTDHRKSQHAKKRKTHFVVALTKIDRCYDWKACPDTPIRDALKEQLEGTVLEFWDRAANAKVQLQENGINSNLYWEMGDDDWENYDFVSDGREETLA